MCKWHKYAIKEAAGDAAGDFNVGHYAVGLTAMALQRIEQAKWNMPEMFEIDGFNPEELLMAAAQMAFKRSGLGDRPLADIKESLAGNIARIRQALADTGQLCDLTKEGLNITDNITRDGYKKTCCAPADPRKNGPFLDAAVVYLFKGYDSETRNYASGELELISADELLALSSDETIPAQVRQYFPLLEGLRSAVEVFLSQPGIREVLADTFKDTLAYGFLTAQDDLDHSRGLAGPSCCVMCKGGEQPRPGL